jgi:hypothetical protein
MFRDLFVLVFVRAILLLFNCVTVYSLKLRFIEFQFQIGVLMFSFCEDGMEC